MRLLALLTGWLLLALVYPFYALVLAAAWALAHPYSLARRLITWGGGGAK